MSGGLIPVLLWVAVPYLLTFGSSFFRKKTDTVPKRPLTLADNVASSLSLVSAFAWVAFGFASADDNVLDTWKVPVDAQASVLKRKFVEYMTKTFPGWQEGNYDMLPSHTAPVAQSMEALYMSLRSLESRRLYAVVGHSAFTGCNWAAEPFDYVYWLVPRIVISYVCMATIIGIATMTQRKRFWRLYGSLILLGGVIYEGYELNLAIASIQSNDNKPMVHHVSTHYMIRCFAFAALSTVIYLFDKADEWTDAEKLKSVIERQRGIYKRLTSTRLAKASVLGDSSLRATFFEFHKQQQAHIEAMMNDEEYTNLRKDVMTRLNLEQLNAEAQALSSNIVVAATQEGLLQSPQPET